MKTRAHSPFRPRALALLALALFAPALRAQDALITPTAITSSTNGTDSFPVARLIDGSGLSNPTPTLAALGTHAAAASANAWATAANAPDYFAGAGALPAPVLTCTLPGPRVVSELVIWGYHSGAADGSEAREFQVAFSTNGVNFGDSVVVTSSPVLIDQGRRLAFSGGARLATHVRVTITDNHFGAAAGGERVGLGELRFVGRAPIVVDTAVDEFNTPSGANVSLREALRDAAAVAGQDAISFAVGLSGQTVAVDSSLAVAGVFVQTTSPGIFTDVAVNAGTLSFGAGSAWTGNGKIQLGATSGSAAATVELNGPDGLALAAPITVRAGSSGVKTLRAANGASATNTFAGGIVLLADATVEKTAGTGVAIFAGDVNVGAQQLTVNANAQVDFNGRLFRGDGTGTARLVMIGTSLLNLGGTGDNTRLVATVNAGLLGFQKTSNSSVHALGGGLPAGTAVLTVGSVGAVFLTGTGGDQIADAASVTMNGLLLLFASDSFDALNGSGTVQADVASTLTVGAGNGSGSFTGMLNSLLSLTKTGTGSQTIGGGDMTGAVLVSGGTLEVSGTLNQITGATVQSGATLAGGGTVANLALESGSFLAPGAPGGIGTLNVAGGTTWNGGATARFHLSGVNNTSDKIASTGALTKAGSGFVFDFQGTGAGGQTYTLATFASTSFVAADFTFTGLAPGVLGTLALTDTALTFSTQSLNVTTTADSGPGSLRQAVATAASNPGADTITFSAALGGPIVLASQIVLGSAVTLDASALPAGATISGGGATRLFFVNIGQTVVFKKLTLTGGNGTGAEPAGFGGAAHNQGTLTLEDCTVAGNTAATSGGGLSSEGIATLTRCTFSQNTSSNSAGGFLNLAGTATVVSCTFSGNTCATVGGAIFNFGGGATMLLRHCTISGNTAASGGGIRNNATLTLTNSIVAGNTGGTTPDIDHLTSATLISSGRSVIGNNSTVSATFPAGTPNANGDFAGTAAAPLDALLAPLANYGGPTQTMALQPGSPARDHAIGSTATADQRGFPIVGTPDIGAFEAGTLANFAAWSQETAGTALAFGNDDDKDGTTNGLEYATRRDAAASDTPLTPALAGTAGARTFTFRYRAAARDLRYIVQRNSDLNIAAAWTDIYRFNTSTGVIDEFLGVTGDENPATEIITLTDPAPGAMLFYRLRVEQLP